METTHVNAEALRGEIRKKYSTVVDTPDGDFHFHTGRFLAEHIGYDTAATSVLPDAAIESFVGVANPFELRPLEPGEKVADLGSGAGLDSFLAATAVGPSGRIVGIDMTPKMLTKSRETAAQMVLTNIDFRDGLLEDLPIEDEWADVVISNGVFNLSPDKRVVFEEAFRILRSGGVLQFADIANGVPVPEEALSDIDLWTG